MNMLIRYAKRFAKQYAKLSPRKRKRVDDTIALFQKDPWDISLRNHPLKGKMKGRRSLYVEYDLRIVFREEGNYVLVSMISVGSHDEVY